MKRIFFIRHFESIANRNNIISGQADISVDDCVINLQKHQDSQFYEVVIISSPLIRCIKTAETLKQKISSTKDIIIDHRLIERGMGIWENERKEIIQKQYPEYFSERRFIYYKTPPKGESFELFSKRVEALLIDLNYLLNNNDIILCSHNQTLKLLYAIIKKIPLDEFWYEKDFKNGVLEEITM